MQKLKDSSFASIFKIAATYIGTVVGAGFASGQEVLQFFAHFGFKGLWGLLFATSMFAFFGWVVMDLGARLNAGSHLEVIYSASGEWLGKVIDYVITFFLFGALTAMLAGAGAIFAEQFHWPALLGSIVMVVVTLITVMLGLNGVITSISLVVPVLLASVVGLGIWTAVATGFFANPVISNLPTRAAVPYWPLSAVVYVSYNLVMAVAILAPMGSKYKEPALIKRGALLGGLGLGIGALAIFLSLAPNLPHAARYEVPMIFVAGQFAPLFKTLYSLVLLAEIYTTAVGNLYGFAARLTPIDAPKARYFVIISSIIALLASQLGFTRLVRILYPAVGYAGIMLLLGLIYGFLKRRKDHGEQEQELA